MIIGFYQYQEKYNFDEVTGVIHVGAHEGQEHEFYKKTFGENITTHWFEPDPEVFKKLVEKLMSDKNSYLYNFALGNSQYKTKLWREESSDHQSSSLMAPKKVLEIYPTLKFEEGPDVYVRTLDSFHISNSNVLVLDVQGFELEVLKGSIKTLPSINHIFSEINGVEMYEKCPSMEELDTFLKNHGFFLRENYWTSGSWGDAYWSR